MWQRPEITKVCFEGIKRLQKSYDVEPICIYSEPELKELCNKYKFECYYHKNLPLGRKFNYGIQKAMQTEWDYLMTLGSDNLITNDLLELYKDYEGKDAFGVNTVYLYDVDSGKCGVFKNGYALGAGRMVKREVFEKKEEKYQIRWLVSAAGIKELMRKGDLALRTKNEALSIIKYGYGELVRIMYSDREVYPDDKNSTLDFTSEFNITCKGYKVEMIETNRVLVLDIKSKINIWPFEFYETIDKDILNEFEEHEQIRRLL